MNVIYIRTSTKEQNPENQTKDCLSLFDGEYKTFEDKQSAWSDNKERVEFEKVKRLIKNRQVKNLYVWDLDRLFRNRKKLMAFFEFCNIYKTNIHSFRQQFLEELNNIPEPFNDIMFNLMLQIMGWLAEEESTKKSQRVKISVRRNDGEPTKSYKGNKWGRKTLSEKVKREILELHEQGYSIRKIKDKVEYWDKHGNKKSVSVGIVHKTINEIKG